MKRLCRWIDRLAKDVEGPTAVEYAVMVGFIIGVCVLAIAQFGTSTNTVYNKQAGKIITAS